MERGEGLHADEIVNHARGVAVVRAIVKFRRHAGGVLKFVVHDANLGHESAHETGWVGMRTCSARVDGHALFFFVHQSSNLTCSARLGEMAPTGFVRSRYEFGSSRSSVSLT